MKPSDFTMISDYLSIAQVDNNTYTITLGGGSIAVGSYTEQNFDFTTKPQHGSIDRIMISKDGGDYNLGAYMTLIPTWSQDYTNNVVGFLNIIRTSSTNLRGQIVLENASMNTSTYPTMSFTVKVSSFKPPNVF